MNNIDFTETGGYPLDQSTLKEIQDNGTLLQNVAGVFGPLVIISGCAVADGVAANGIVVINGEVLPFVGGAVAAKVIVVETDTDVTYFDTTVKPSVHVRIATFGDDGIQNNPWANFLTVPSQGLLAFLNSQWQTGDVKEIDCSEAYITANFVDTGLGTNARLGWAICNGNNGTKDRRGKVPVQRDPAETEFAAMGDTGGEKTHLLSAAEIPPLSSEDSFEETAGSATNGFASAPVGTTRPLSVNPDGGAAHNNLQPYITTLFIQKL